MYTICSLSVLRSEIISGFTLADLSCLLTVMIIIVFSPSVMAIAFVGRRRLLKRIATSVSEVDHHFYLLIIEFLECGPASAAQAHRPGTLLDFNNN